MKKVSKLPFFKTAGWTLLGSVQAIAESAFGTLSPERGQKIIRVWVHRVFRSGKATFHAEGLEHIDAEKPYVVMSNHASLLDIPALLGAWPGRLRMVSKTEIGKIPIFGEAMKRMEFVFIDRGNPARAIQQLEDAKALLQEGVSVWIAPEGTRSRTGKLGPFKKGGFYLATQLGVPIVPTWVDGTSDIISPDTFNVRYSGHVTVRFGKPIPTEGLGKADVPKLMRDVREAMLALSGRPREEIDGGDEVQGRDPFAERRAATSKPRPKRPRGEEGEGKSPEASRPSAAA